MINGYQQFFGENGPSNNRGGHLDILAEATKNNADAVIDALARPRRGRQPLYVSEDLYSIPQGITFGREAGKSRRDIPSGFVLRITDSVMVTGLKNLESPYSKLFLSRDSLLRKGGRSALSQALPESWLLSMFQDTESKPDVMIGYDHKLSLGKVVFKGEAGLNGQTVDHPPKLLTGDELEGPYGYDFQERLENSLEAIEIARFAVNGLDEATHQKGRTTWLAQLVDARGPAQIMASRTLDLADRFRR